VQTGDTPCSLPDTHTARTARERARTVRQRLVTLACNCSDYTANDRSHSFSDDARRCSGRLTGHRGTPSIKCSDEAAVPHRPPHTVYRSRSCERPLVVAEGRSRTDKLDGVIKHRPSRETTMVGRRASLHGHLLLGGTDDSNPLPSSGESVANLVIAKACPRLLSAVGTSGFAIQMLRRILTTCGPVAPPSTPTGRVRCLSIEGEGGAPKPTREIAFSGQTFQKRQKGVRTRKRPPLHEANSLSPEPDQSTIRRAGADWNARRARQGRKHGSYPSC